MPTIEAIRRITIEQRTTGGEAVRTDLLATAAAQQRVGDTAGAAAIVAETASRRQLSAAGAFQKLREQVDQAARSAAAYDRAMGVLNRASAQGIGSTAEHARLILGWWKIDTEPRPSRREPSRKRPGARPPHSGASARPAA